MDTVLRMEQLQKLDRNSYAPRYAQLVRILQGRIASGELRPGDRLPSEAQLCKQHRVSPMTVRRAINILSQLGIVVTSQGRGTFVNSIQFWAATFCLDGLQHVLEDEKGTTVKILEASIRLADERVAGELAIRTGQRTIYIRRLIYSQAKPFIYHREYVIYDPKRPIVESEMNVTSLKGLFERVGDSTLKRSTLTIEATVLKEEEAELLESPVQAPAFRLEHIFYDFDDRPVSWGWFICPGDRLRFTTVVGIRDRSYVEDESRK